MPHPLSRYELRVLKAIDERPGGTTIPVIAQMTDHSEVDIRVSLSILEHDALVISHTIERTGTTWWRATRAGRDRLIATPPPRLRRARRHGIDQLELAS